MDQMKADELSKNSEERRTKQALPYRKAERRQGETTHSLFAVSS